MTIALIDKAIADAEKQIIALKEQLRLEKLDSPDQQLAKELHGMLCTHNHTDGCGWYYEMKDKKDDWVGYAHTSWLTKVQTFTGLCAEKDINLADVLEAHKILRAL